MPASDQVGAGDADWRLELAVAFTPEEMRRAVGLRERVPADTARAGMRLFWAAVAVGVAGGLMAAMLHVVPVERGAGIAVGGFLSCLAGEWMHYWSVRRLARRRAMGDLGEPGVAWAVLLDPAGMTWRVPDGSTFVGWTRVKRAGVVDGLVQIRTQRGYATVIPERCLPAGWTGARLAAAVNAAVARVAPAGP